MSDNALVQVQAQKFEVGDYQFCAIDWDVFSEDINDDNVIVTRPPKTEEERLFCSIMNQDEVDKVLKPLWCFRFTAIGDWTGTFTNGVDVIAEEAGWEELLEDASVFVEIAERRLATRMKELSKMTSPDTNPKFPVSFVLLYAWEYHTRSGPDGTDTEYWVNLVGEVDLGHAEEILMDKTVRYWVEEPTADEIRNAADILHTDGYPETASRLNVLAEAIQLVLAQLP